MASNSFAYFGFLAAGAVLYNLLPKRAGKLLLVILSLIFYWIGAPGFLWLLLVTIGLTYGIGIWIERSQRKKTPLALGLVLNLGTLALFKYLGFFGIITSHALELFGLQPLQLPALILPLGISFYEFVCCGYLIDVFRNKCEAEKNPFDFVLFVGFFPAILSGPIERANHMLPQIKNLSKADGDDLKFAITRLICGLCKKVLIADNLAILVNTAYANYSDFSGLQLLIAAIAYSLQIYFDFSAYSEMAVGAARLFGIELIENFRAPYLARSAKEFWHRWHISLSTWFRDYLYFPLGGSRKGKLRTYFNIMIVFALSGLWHGAATKFVVWGLLCGFYQVMGSILLPTREKVLKVLHIRENSWWTNVIRVLFTFGLTTIAWVFFRSDSLTHALRILKRIFIAGGACFPLVLTDLGLSVPMLCVLGIALVVILTSEALEEPLRLRECLLNTVWLRYAVWIAMLIAIAVFGAYGSGYDAQEFVYFQF